MSLINEALKKAQGERPAQASANPGSENNPPREGHYQPPPGKNRKSFLWGFILAVFVVGTFTILLSTYFVMQILGPEEAGEAAAPGTTVKPAEAVASSDGSPELADPRSAETSAAKPASEEPATVREEQAVNEAPVPAQPAMPPDPAVIARLMELEIRGIMSGGARVLIFDQASGRNKAYRAGDSLEGKMGLVVENISNSSIKFKDYAGQIHTKSF